MLTQANIDTIARLAGQLARDLEKELPAHQRAAAMSLVIAAMPSIVTEVARQAPYVNPEHPDPL